MEPHPWKKSPSSKSWGPVKHPPPFFWKFGRRFNPPPSKKGRGTHCVNKLLTKWNLLQAFLIHYLWQSLHLWWRGSWLNVFPKVSSSDEKSLGKIILSCFFGSVNKKVLIFGDLHFSFLYVLHVYIFHFILSFFDLRR